MRLSRAILINWGTLPDRTFEFLGTTALTGETGSGKTSVIDAFITVMTGGSSRLGRLNSASDDGKGVRKRDAVYRTIESYVLGGHNKLFARESAYGYVALVFEPEENEKSRARPFSAVLAAAAIQRKNMLGAGNEVRSAELQEVFYLAVDGVALTMADFVVSEKAKSREAMAVEAIGKHLKDRYPGRRSGIDIAIYRKDQHADYLRRLYGALEGRGEVSLERAQSQATIWSRFVGQEHIDEISQFVRQFVLSAPADFTELQKISDGVRASRRLNEQAKLVVERLEYLESALKAGEGFGRQAITAKSLECAVHRRAYNDANETSRRAGLSAKESRRKRDEANELVKSQDEQLAALRNQEVEIRAKLLGVPSWQRAEDLKAAQGVQQLHYTGAIEGVRRRAEVLGALSKRLNALHLPTDVSAANRTLALLLAKATEVAPGTEALSKLSSACEGVNPNTRSTKALESLRDLATPTEEAADRLRDILCGEGRPLNTEASSAIAALNSAIDAASRQLAEKKEDVNRIEHGNSVSYPRNTKDTLEYLKARIAKAEPAVLCDLVTEVRDESWQSAIEGYIGNNRFAIIVKPEFEPEVNVLLEGRRKEGRTNASVVQGGLALTERQDDGSKLPADSIVHDLIVDNPYAKAFLHRIYGNVVKVKSADQLHKVRNGITRDGRGSGALRTFDAYADAGDLTFGKRARERRREKRLQEIAALEEQLSRLNRQVEFIAALAQFDKVFEGFQGSSVHVHCSEALTALAEINRIYRQIEAIDLSEARDLRETLDNVTSKMELLKVARDKKFREAVEHGKDAEGYDRTENLQAGNAMRAEGLRRDATQDMMVLAAQAPWVDAEKIQSESDVLAYDVAQSVESLQGQKEAAWRRLTDVLGTLRAGLGQYNGVAATQEDAIDAKELFAHDTASPGMFTAVSRVVTRGTEIQAALKNSQLARLNVEIETTNRTLRSAFSAHFCNRLLREIENGVATIRDLNGELELQEFGRDTYRFQMEWSSESYKNRHAFFQRIREKSADENFDMFTEQALEKQDIPVRDEIMSLFLEAAEEGGKAALMQIADYRQYRRYDLLKVMTIAGKEHESSMSLQMTDSGGEKETGLFVARVATVTGGLGLREPGPHLRTVVIDELFKKTDEPRIRTAIDYLTKVRKLHVIFAMPTRAIGPFKDVIDSEYAITRMQSDTLNGQLDHFVHVEHHVYNKDEVAKLKEKKRLQVRNQAELEFEAKEREETST